MALYSYILEKNKGIRKKQNNYNFNNKINYRNGRKINFLEKYLQQIKLEAKISRTTPRKSMEGSANCSRRLSRSVMEWSRKMIIMMVTNATKIWLFKNEVTIILYGFFLKGRGGVLQFSLNCPVHLKYSRFNHPDSIRWKIETMKFLIVKLSPFLILILLFPKTRQRILLSNILSLRFSSNVRDNASQPYIIVLYILIFKFLEKSREY